MLSLLPDVLGQMVLPVGCGPGVYAEVLVARGAGVVPCDVSERMLKLANPRLSFNDPDGNGVEVYVDTRVENPRFEWKGEYQVVHMATLV